MIGRLVSKNVRTVYEKKVLRITVDIPFKEAKDATLDGRDLLAYLDHRVDKPIGLKLTTLEDEGMSLDDHGGEPDIEEIDIDELL